jgi:hypothetical protein
VYHIFVVESVEVRFTSPAGSSTLRSLSRLFRPSSSLSLTLRWPSPSLSTSIQPPESDESSDDSDSISQPSHGRPHRSLPRHRMPPSRLPHALSLGDLQEATAVHRQYQSRKEGRKESYHKAFDIHSGLFDVSGWSRLTTMRHTNTSCLSPLAPLEHVMVDFAI